MKRLWKTAAIILAVADMIVALTYITSYAILSGVRIPDSLNLHMYKTVIFFERDCKPLLLDSGIMAMLNFAFVAMTLRRGRRTEITDVEPR